MPGHRKFNIYKIGGNPVTIKYLVLTVS